MAGLEPTTVFSAVEYTTDFMVVHHIEFGTPLDYSQGLPETHRLTVPSDRAAIDGIVAALRNCRQTADRPELANSEAISLLTRGGARVTLALASSRTGEVVYLDHCRYHSRELYGLLDEIRAARRGLARRKWCE